VFEMAGDVRITLLGGFAASVDGTDVPEAAWRLKKARELVKLLALAPGHRLHREQVMDVLWRDRSPSAAANNLNQAVHVARRALLPDAIEVRDEVLALVADVDVDRFELAAAGARRVASGASYRAALRVYGGELLPENRYDDWAESRRSELAALAEELAHEAAALAAADRFELPADTSSFIGRERELEELDGLLQTTRLLTLAGTGGAGKTRLALELARGAERTYAAGAALVELAPVTSPALVADAVAGVLDLRSLPSQDITDALVEFLAQRRLLLVLDNCEHVLAATAALAHTLLRSAPELTILATSREPLRLPGEVVFRVPSLHLPRRDDSVSPERLRRYEAVSLFVARAEAAAPGFELDETNAADVARICVRLDGLPLALELAAGRLGALSANAIAERLDDRFRLLRSGSGAAPTRQQTLAATLQWSHDLLEADETVLFRRLAIFAGGFELEAAEAVCAGAQLETSQIADLLARLVEKSLVSIDDAAGTRRYRLLETVRLYAREQLTASGDAAEASLRHAQWALELAELERGSPSLDRETPNLRAALDTLLAEAPVDALRLCVALFPFWLRRIELDEARQRLRTALAANPELTTLRVEGLLAAAAIEFRAAMLAEGTELAEQSRAAAAELGDAQREWRALQFLGEFGLAVDAEAVAVQRFERALELARREGFAAAEAITIHSLGVAAWIDGDLERADELVAQSIDAFRALGDTTQTVPSPVNIAEIRIELPGGRPGPRLLFEDTLQPFVEVSCNSAVGYALANQAGIARARGDLERAWSLLDESDARFRAGGDETGLATSLVRRAYTSLVAGDLGAAQSGLEQALELRAALGDRRGRGMVLSGLGLVATTAGDYARAERALAEARDIFRRAGDRWALVGTLWRIADLAFARGKLDEAEAAFNEALPIVRPTRRERWLASTLAGLAEVALLRGDGERGADLLHQARAHYAAGSDEAGIAATDARLATLLSTR
jgi:predicted ATPase